MASESPRPSTTHRSHTAQSFKLSLVNHNFQQYTDRMHLPTKFISWLVKARQHVFCFRFKTGGNKQIQPTKNNRRVHYHRCHNNSFRRTSVSKTKDRCHWNLISVWVQCKGLICQHHCLHWCNASHLPSQVGPMNCLTVSSTARHALLHCHIYKQQQTKVQKQGVQTCTWTLNTLKQHLQEETQVFNMTNFLVCLFSVPSYKKMQNNAVTHTHTSEWNRDKCCLPE